MLPSGADPKGKVGARVGVRDDPDYRVFVCRAWKGSPICRDKALALSEGRTDLKVCPYTPYGEAFPPEGRFQLRDMEV